MRNELGSTVMERQLGPVSEVLGESIAAAGPLMDERDIARRLGCSEATVARLRKGGRLGFVTVGRHDPLQIL